MRFVDGSRGGISRRLRLVAIALPAALVVLYVAIDHYVVEVLLPRDLAHLALLAIGVACVVAFSLAIFGRVEQLASEMEAKSATLRALNVSGLTLSAELSSELVLQRIADLARDVGKARYAALGVFDDDGRITHFCTSGLSAVERERLGALPEGRGLLGLLLREQRPIRLRELKDHPASVPFPPHHPPMHSFLGVPVIWRKRSVGNLYLTEKIDAPEFTADDEQALITFAAQAAIAIENARLYEQEGHMATLEERHRIGMDLHDGAMQTLYGVSLLVESAATDITERPERARLDLGRAVDRLNAAIADLRSYVLELRPIRGSDRALAESLPEVARQIAANALLRLDLDVRQECDALLDKNGREAIFYVAADALTNIARHARASQVRVRLIPEGDKVVLEVVDDGVGFDSDRAVDGFGLRNMRERAFAVGGLFGVETAPGSGTRVRLELPVKEEAR